MKTKRQMKKQGWEDGLAGRPPQHQLCYGLTKEEYELIDTYVAWYGYGKVEREGGKECK